MPILWWVNLILVGVVVHFWRKGKLPTVRVNYPPKITVLDPLEGTRRQVTAGQLRALPPSQTDSE